MIAVSAVVEVATLVVVAVVVRVVVTETVTVFTFEPVAVRGAGWLTKQLQALLMRAAVVPAGLK